MAEEDIKRVMDEMPYGLYIIGTRDDGEVNAMMADWVMQVSFRPRLVAVSFENDAHSLANVRATGAFSINLLSQDEDSMKLASKFAQPYEGSKVAGRMGEAASRVHHKLEGIDYSVSEHGCPILDAGMAWLECEVEQFVSAGDHTLVVGRVVDGRVQRDAEPLTSTFTGWTYSG